MLWTDVGLTHGANPLRRVELKVMLDPGQSFTAIADRLGMRSTTLSTGYLRYLDDAANTLSGRGVTIQIREFGRQVELGVKLRADAPHRMSSAVRRLPGFSSELDALPDRIQWSASIKNSVKRPRRSPRPNGSWFDYCSPAQLVFLASVTGSPSLSGYTTTFGPIMVDRLIGSNGELPRLMLERWILPGGQELLELSTKCPPRRAERAAKAMRSLVRTHELLPKSRQRTKTEVCLRAWTSVVAAA
jgi:hypothetical protein